VTARILRTELRRSWAPLTAVLSVVVTMVMLYSTGNKAPWMHSGKAWDADWVPSALWVRYMLILTFPVAFGAGVVQGRRDHRSGMVELLGTVPRAGRTRALPPAVAMALAAVAGYLVVQFVGMVQVAYRGGYFSLAWIPVVLIGLLAVVTGTLLGQALGRLMPHPVTAPLATVAAFAVVVWLGANAGPGGSVPPRLALLGPTLPEPASAWRTAAARVDLGQAVWLIALAVTGFLLLVAGSRRARLLAVVPAAAGALVAVAAFPADPSKVLVPYSGADPVCSGPVCVTRLHQSELAVLAGPGRQALVKLAKVDNPPQRVEEPVFASGSLDAPPPDADVVKVVLTARGQYAGKRGADLERALVAGAGLPSCENTTSDYEQYVVRARAAQTVSAAWFMGDLQPVFGASSWNEKIMEAARPAWRTFQALAPDEQLRRVNALRHEELNCSGADPLDLLTKDAAE